MSQFLIKRGKAAVNGKRKAHLAKYDAAGNITGAFCREVVDAGWISSNVPWGLKQCKHCLRAYWKSVRGIS